MLINKVQRGLPIGAVRGFCLNFQSLYLVITRFPQRNKLTFSELTSFCYKLKLSIMKSCRDWEFLKTTNDFTINLYLKPNLTNVVYLFIKERFLIWNIIFIDIGWESRSICHLYSTNKIINSSI